MIRINYSYYNNYELLDTIIKYYEPYKEYFKFTIIDDGSQIEPLTRDLLPEWITGYRITEDLGWGNEVCKNILMRETDCEWNALMDLDYVIDLEHEPTFNLLSNTFTNHFDELKHFKVCCQFAIGTRVDYNDWTVAEDTPGNINSFIISRTAFFKTYGYDPSFYWYYGNDVSLFRQLDREVILSNTKVTKLASQASPREEAPGDQSIYIPIKEYQAKLERMGVYNPSTCQWRTEADRLNFSKPLPAVVAI